MQKLLFFLTLTISAHSYFLKKKCSIAIKVTQVQACQKYSQHFYTHCKTLNVEVKVYTFVVNDQKQNHPKTKFALVYCFVLITSKAIFFTFIIAKIAWSITFLSIFNHLWFFSLTLKVNMSIKQNTATWFQHCIGMNSYF